MSMIKKLIMIAGITLFLGNCAPKNPVLNPTVLPTPPKRSPIAHVDAQNVDNGITEAIKRNSTISEQIKQHQKYVLDQNIAITEAIAKTEIIKNKIETNQVVSDDEIGKLQLDIQNIKARNLFVEKENTDLEKSRAEQSDILNSTSHLAKQLQTKIVQLESEVDALRLQNTDLDNIIKTKDVTEQTMKNNFDKLQREKESISKDAASASVYKHWVIGLATGFILFSIAKAVLFAYGLKFPF